jgi:hypothetical protein
MNGSGKAFSICFCFLDSSVVYMAGVLLGIHVPGEEVFFFAVR